MLPNVYIYINIHLPYINVRLTYPLLGYTYLYRLNVCLTTKDN